MILKAWLLVIILGGNIDTHIYVVESECRRAAYDLQEVKNVKARCVERSILQIKNLGPKRPNS